MKNENCDKKLFCDDYKFNHCDGCGANKPKGDLISREALKKAIDKEFEKADLSDYEACSCVCEIYDKCIDNAPTVEPTIEPICEVKFDKEQLQEIVDKVKAEVLASVERPQGEWIKGEEISRTMLGNKVEHIDYRDYTCSNCGLVLENLFYWSNGSPFYKFCPNCGADMRGGVEHGSNDR